MGKKKDLILILEDDRTLQMLYECVLGGEFELQQWDSIQGAEAVLHTESPVLAIIDLGLPGEQSGIDFVRRLRERPGCSGIPILVISAFTEAMHRRQALKAGADRFLAKPVSLDLLQTAVREMLTASSRETQHPFSQE